MDEVFTFIKKERELQEKTLRMIPSENFTSKAVREAVGSVLMHKYSEGYPGKRYYQGNEVMDEIERLCQERALVAFGLKAEVWGVNVQALSGSPANLAVYTALLEPGDRIMAMYLPDGGHLSHGWKYGEKKVTLVSKIWNVAFYHVDPKTEQLDYNRIRELAKEFKPKLLVSGGTAYPREIDHQKMGKIAHEIGAFYLADIAHEAGLVVSEVNGSPFPYADVVTMTTHKTLRGPRGALIFSKKEISSDIDRAVFPGIQGGPHNEVIAGIAVALVEARGEQFGEYSGQVVKNAQLLAKILGDAGYHVVSGGTDKHLVLLDLRPQNLSGWVAAWALEKAGIIVNRNTVPQETASPYFPSGLRMGTPFITTRGMKEPEMTEIGGYILEVLKYCEKWQLPAEKQARQVFIKSFRKEIGIDRKLKNIQGKVEDLCRKFPLPE